MRLTTIRHSVIFLGLALVCAQTAAAQDATVAKVDDFVKSEMKKQRLPGVSLAVVKNGEVVLAKGYGFANVEHRVAVKPETPEDKKLFVADPSQGSRHNRGAAVDLTLYDLKTGQPVEMVGTYDETTDRSYPEYPGGTSLQRWHRELLRDALESEGFTVCEAEWWHFDYDDWRKYPIGNVVFDKIK